MTGLDMSPHFLAVAELREREHEQCARTPQQAARQSSTQCTTPPLMTDCHALRVVCCHGRATAGGQSRRRIEYRHGLGESTGLPTASLDLVTLQFMIHEVSLMTACCMHVARSSGLVSSCYAASLRGRYEVPHVPVTCAVPSARHSSTGDGSAAASAAKRSAGNRRQRSQVQSGCIRLMWRTRPCHRLHCRWEKHGSGHAVDHLPSPTSLAHAASGATIWDYALLSCRSPVIQNLPPALFILMKSTEPCASPPWPRLARPRA